MKSACVEFCRRRKFKRDERNTGGGIFNWLPAICALLLAGCSLGPFIAENSIDYNTTVENVTNSVLVTNILRGRDAAPLYFSDLSQIRGSMQLNLQAGQTTIPYAHFLNSTTPSTAQAGPLTINTQPGFDVAPLNTKKFAQGMLEGIDPRIFAYFIQRGIDANVFLKLVVSRIERYRKTDDGNYRLVDWCGTDDCRPTIEKWTDNPKRPPHIGLLSSKTDLGPPIPAKILAEQQNTLRNLVEVDAADDLDLDPTTKHKQFYQLSHTKDKFVLCVPLDGRFDAVGIWAPGATKDPKAPPVPKQNGTCGKGPGSKDRLVIYTRSVEALFYYLGGVLKDPEHAPIPFYVYDHPVERSRFHTVYRGRLYYVREADGSDATMTILAILNDLLNLNRDANEIPSTKTVATTP